MVPKEYIENFKAKEEELVEEIQDKTHLHLREDFAELAIFVWLKSVEKELHLDQIQKDEYMVYYMLVAMIQLVIVIMLAMNITFNPSYDLFVSEEMSIIYVKQSCGIALHFIIFPDINQSMKLMKYINTYPYYVGRF